MKRFAATIRFGLVITIVIVAAVLMLQGAGEMTIVLATLTTFIIYFWSADLIGRSWALLPAFLFAFSPTVLHAASTGDVIIIETLALFAALFAFLHFLLHPERRYLVAAIIATGVAAIASGYSIFLIPLFILLMLVFYLASVGRDWQFTPAEARAKRFGIRAFRYFRALFVILIGGHIIAAAVFLLMGTAPADVWPEFIARFALIQPPSLPSTLGGQPLPFLILLAIATLAALWRTTLSFFKSLFAREPLFLDYLGTHFTEFSLLAAAVILLVFGAPLLFTLPLLVILMASSVRNTIRIRSERRAPLLIKLVILYRERFGVSVKSLILATLLVWYFINAVMAL